MKNLKKLASLLLVLVMVFALAAPALAEGEKTGTITIEQAPYNQEYKIYRIFDLESYVTAGEGEKQEDMAHSYKTNDKWAAFVTGAAAGTAYVTVDEQGYVTWNEDADAVAFAAAALAWAKENNMEADATATTGALPEGKDPAAMDATVTTVPLPLGYYLVSSSVGALCSLNTTNQNATVHEKNTLPTLDKETVPPTDGSNNPGVGDSLNYQITLNAKANVKENYVVHDTMGKGLSFKNDVEIEGLTKGTDYTVTYPATDGCTFDVVFTDEFKNALTEDREIVITYSATITAEALTVDTVNNTAHLSYGDPLHTLNTKDIPVDYDLYAFNLVKTSSEKTGSVILQNAKFELYTTKENGEPIQLVQESGYYRPAMDGETSTTTITAGIAVIKGLGEGTYYLEETEQPEGYNRLKSRVLVEIVKESDLAEVEIKTDTNGKDTYMSGGFRVENLTGAELPSTGGIGTTLFYIVGGLLIVGAAVLLITKKRVNGEQ